MMLATADELQENWAAHEAEDGDQRELTAAPISTIVRPLPMSLPRSISRPMTNSSRSKPKWAIVSMFAGSVTSAQSERADDDAGDQERGDRRDLQPREHEREEAGDDQAEADVGDQRLGAAGGGLATAGRERRQGCRERAHRTPPR